MAQLVLFGSDSGSFFHGKAHWLDLFAPEHQLSKINIEVDQNLVSLLPTDMIEVVSSLALLHSQPYLSGNINYNFLFYEVDWLSSPPTNIFGYSALLPICLSLIEMQFSVNESFKHQPIVATGSLDKLGNVLPVGHVEEKLQSLIDIEFNGIFVYPSQNELSAAIVKSAKDNHIKVYTAQNITELLSYLYPKYYLAPKGNQLLLETYQKEDSWRFYGRDQEIKALSLLVKKHDIINIYGPAQSGKTSLARAGLANVLGDFHYIDLANQDSTNLKNQLLDSNDQWIIIDHITQYQNLENIPNKKVILISETALKGFKNFKLAPLNQKQLIDVVQKGGEQFGVYISDIYGLATFLSTFDQPIFYLQQYLKSGESHFDSKAVKSFTLDLVDQRLSPLLDKVEESVHVNNEGCLLPRQPIPSINKDIKHWQQGKLAVQEKLSEYTLRFNLENDCLLTKKQKLPILSLFKLRQAKKLSLPLNDKLQSLVKRSLTFWRNSFLIITPLIGLLLLLLIFAPN